MIEVPATRKLERVFVLIIIVSFAVALAMQAYAVVEGANIVSNFTEGAPVKTPGSRADDGGTITVLDLDTTQQNDAWKAYVGNVSGRLTLDDANLNTIYDWDIQDANIQGEVYVSRNDSVDFTNVSCANQTTVNNEQSALSMSSSDVDSINSTFNYSTHKEMQVGTITISQNTCRSTATYVNDTRQSITNTSLFQEILLQDTNLNMVYASFIETDEWSYKTGAGGNETTYDFQLIVAEDDQAGTPSTYYFYLEISS